MLSLLPKSPARGRSRFSKALPVPPGNPSSPPSLQSPFSPASQRSEKMSETSSPRGEVASAPPAPEVVANTISKTLSIPRRPVGGPKHAKTPSVSSSVYSESPGIPRRQSDSSISDTKDSLSGVDSEGGPTPPLPPKDSHRPQNISQSAYHDLTRPLSIESSLNSSPPRQEIWKRRSMKSDKSISFSDLKLDRSNGSTASPPNKQEQPTDRPTLPRSIRGRKPVPSRPAPPQPQPADIMGGKLAKLKNKLLRDRSDKTDKASISTKDEVPSPSNSYGTPPFKRLPTPEFLDTDKKQPPTPQIKSPLSPDTPPQDAPQIPQIPQRSDSRNPVPASKVLQSTNTPNLLAEHSRKSSDTLTATSEPAVMQSPQPQKAFTAARILTPQPSPDKTSPLALPSPVIGRIQFPTMPPLASPNAVLPGPPLTDQHFNCYQSHKYMRGTRNVLCPVGCMICGRKDKEQRWRCTWCCLSACGPCMKVLTSLPEKNLQMCVDRLGR